MNSSSQILLDVYILSKQISDISLLEGQALRYEEFLSDWSDSMQRVIIIDLLECLAPARHLVQRWHWGYGVIWALRGPVWQVFTLGDMGGQKSGISGGRWWRHQWVHGRFSVSNQPVYPSVIFRVWLDLCRYCLWDYENPIHVEMVWGR